MKKLTSYIALRSWDLIPYAYYTKHNPYAQKLTQEEFFQLESEMENSDNVSDWQKPLYCENKYFPAMNFEITGRCNFNCLHCFNAADNNRLQHEFSLDEATKLLDEARICGINAITVTGGEPLIHPHFLEIMEMIYERGMYVNELNTNGSYLTQDILNKLKKMDCCPLMKISFDGIGHHDWLRNRDGAENQAISAIKLCVDNGFPVMAQMNVHRLNIKSILPSCEMLDELGVWETRIIRTSEAPRWLKNSDGLCEGGACLTIEEYYDNMLDFASEYIAKPHKMKISIWQFLCFDPILKTYTCRPAAYTDKSYRDSLPVCKGNRGMIAIGADGNVTPCMQLSGYYSDKGLYLGNVKKDGLQKLLTSGDYLKTVCTTVKELAENNTVCKNCPYFKRCAGGCRALAMALTHDEFGCDLTKCFFFKNGYDDKTDDVFLKREYTRNEG